MSKPFYSFNSTSTSVNYAWPDGLTGIERVALASQGDLQRVLSAFFARTIQITPIHTHTRLSVSPDLPDVPLDVPNDSALASASPQTPITQTRQVLLQCAEKTVCTATSNVRITSPDCARLFLVDKFPIGQLFRKMGKLPDFELIAVGFDKVEPHGETGSDGEQVWRKYRLSVDGFESEILEVFPSRRMFLSGEKWLTGSISKTLTERRPCQWQRSMFILLLAVFATILLTGKGQAYTYTFV